jgi:hypothetical protein
MKDNTEDLLRKMAALQDTIEIQIPVETTVVFGEFEDQPMRSVWNDEEMETLKSKMLELVDRL